MKADAGGRRREGVQPELSGRSGRAWEELARLALQPVGATKLSAQERLERMALLPDRDRTSQGRYGGVGSPEVEQSMTDEVKGSMAVPPTPRVDSSWFPHREDAEESPLPTARAEFDG
jgi:hypothetical protein